MRDDFWEKNFGITPQPVSDLDVWRAANQMLKMFPEDAELSAAQRADKALEMGDVFNLNLRSRVTMAIHPLNVRNQIRERLLIEYASSLID